MTAKGAKQAAWTADELAAVAGGATTLPGRSAGAIKRQRLALGIKRGPAGPQGPMERYTEGEDGRLRAGAIHLAGRSYGATWLRRKHLGLTGSRAPAWTEDEVLLLRAGARFIPGRTVDSVRHKRMIVAPRVRQLRRQAEAAERVAAAQARRAARIAARTERLAAAKARRAERLAVVMKARRARAWDKAERAQAREKFRQERRAWAASKRFGVEARRAERMKRAEEKAARIATSKAERAIRSAQAAENRRLQPQRNYWSPAELALLDAKQPIPGRSDADIVRARATRLGLAACPMKGVPVLQRPARAETPGEKMLREIKAVVGGIFVEIREETVADAVLYMLENGGSAVEAVRAVSSDVKRRTRELQRGTNIDDAFWLADDTAPEPFAELPDDEDDNTT